MAQEEKKLEEVETVPATPQQFTTMMFFAVLFTLKKLKPFKVKITLLF